MTPERLKEIQQLVTPGSSRYNADRIDDKIAISELLALVDELRADCEKMTKQWPSDTRHDCRLMCIFCEAVSEKPHAEDLTHAPDCPVVKYSTEKTDV